MEMLMNETKKFKFKSHKLNHHRIALKLKKIFQSTLQSLS